MNQPVEIELKLDFDPADRERLAACSLLGPAPAATRRLAATYFDTPARHLDKAGYALRIRKEGGKRIQTVKAASSDAAGLFVRGEWERRVTTDAPVFDDRSGPLSQLFEADLLARVEPVFTTAIDRTEGPVDRPDGSRLEYAIDVGEVRAGTRSSAVCELELELKQGTPQLLFDLARTIGEQVPLRLGVLTKSERGYALAEKAFTAAVKAEPLKLDRTMAAGDAFAAIAAACLRQYRRNEDLLLLSAGVEQLHQARVALRRLRSAFWLFKPLLEGDARAVTFASELRWLAGELGEIRDIDVLVPRLEDPARSALFAVRESRFGHLRNQLDGGRVRRLPIELAEWLALGQWRTEPADPGPRDRDIRSFAGERLDRLRRRIKREGKGLADIGDDHRHEVRKDAKKLRYATEFFISLYPGRKPRQRIDRFLDRLEALQDKLGRLNDIAAAPGLFEQLGVEAELPLPGKKERKRLLDDAEDCFEAFIDSKRFWRD
ncbi:MULTISPECIES: CYTH and CHAD domain-containing protein [unclassified Sphingomonas]|uniref:CYTH and CHAD domain-containing protein n=1 Tax=unclassified Sphingomonas TaxID=196159 RepID=UPI0006FE2298|nr:MULTISPECIES: CYTH and CHAD domain-containing protein [unclassified Sphingomonas]KQX18011.1 CHAD domain-containing protein [Sphingomonas sp. Root1294]KQY70936.1 CHAD domain-containing protein [Sphingomonas sp. Root50]KRB91566.1 CHAD domain-containing protein [Sphingomonas sp. Root720]